MQTKTTLSTLIMPLLAFAAACGGMDPSGGKPQPRAAAPAPAPAPAPGDDQSGDAGGVSPTPGNAIAGLNEANADKIAACHASGMLFERRFAVCSPELRLARSYECTDTGIAQAFAATGFQIDVALDDAYADGFELDQCGESDDGVRAVHLVRIDTVNGERKVRVRELESDVDGAAAE